MKIAGVETEFFLTIDDSGTLRATVSLDIKRRSLMKITYNIRKPIHFLQRVKNVAPSVVVWPPCCLSRPPCEPALKLNWASLFMYR